MILYLDTSALVKLYVEEPLSQELTVAVSEAEAVATSLIAYAETRATFARARRETRLSAQIYRRIVETFVEDWPRYISVEVTDRLEASGSFNAMVSHRVRLSKISNVDRELIKWLKEAYQTS